VFHYHALWQEADPELGSDEIDFCASRDHGYVPTVKALGHEPVRADQDTGSTPEYMDANSRPRELSLRIRPLQPTDLIAEV
jgi:hypothetical protein